MDGFDPAAFDRDARPIRVEIQHPTRSLPVDRCRQLLGRVAQGEDVRIKELTLILADHATVLDLNRRFLDHDYHTDVLAFDYSDGTEIVQGEVYVDLDTAHERYAEFGAAFEEEALRYVVHGLLHLVGYSDKTPEGRKKMRALEDRYLAEGSS